MVLKTTDPVKLASGEGSGTNTDDGKLAAPVPHMPYYYQEIERWRNGSTQSPQRLQQPALA